MLTEEENRLITLTGPGTPGGALLRHYWHPVALSSELPPGGAPVPLKILGEELVLFRDEQGRPGLLGLYCSHRCADLSYGRIENGGLRCLYHGWLYDIHGRCLEQPAEPPESRYKDEIRHPAHPVIERAGALFAYLGQREPPLLPSYECLSAAPEHLYVQKVHMECNYFQALEGDIDPAHLSYLHLSWQRRPFARKGTVPGSDRSAGILHAQDGRPRLESELTDFGVRNYAIRNVGNGERYIRINNFVMPNKITSIGNEGRVGEGYTIHWHVPTDDENHVRFDFFYNRAHPIAGERYDQEAALETVDHRYRRNKRNRYLQNRDEMITSNFSGMGGSNAVQDAWASETPGAIHDRSREHLGTSDTHIVAARRALLAGTAAVQAGREPIHVIRDPAQDDMSHIVVASAVIPPGADYRELWKQKMREQAKDRAATLATGAGRRSQMHDEREAAEPLMKREPLAGRKRAEIRRGD
jgi:phenylpropionate dioxygenase-like ring-hydroxylating dioxygenase large terminal subunit